MFRKTSTFLELALTAFVLLALGHGMLHQIEASSNPRHHADGCQTCQATNTSVPTIGTAIPEFVAVTAHSFASSAKTQTDFHYTTDRRFTRTALDPPQLR